MIRQKKERAFKIMNQQGAFQTFNNSIQQWMLMKLNKLSLSKISQQDFIIPLTQAKKKKNKS